MTYPIREEVLDSMLDEHVTQTRVTNQINTPLGQDLTVAQVKFILKLFLNYNPFRIQLYDRQQIERAANTIIANLQQLQGSADPALLLSDETTTLNTALTDLAVFDGII